MIRVFLILSFFTILVSCEEPEYLISEPDIVFEEGDCKLFWRSFVQTNAIQADPISKLYISCVKSDGLLDTQEILKTRWGKYKFPIVSESDFSINRKSISLKYCSKGNIHTTVSQAKSNYKKYKKTIMKIYHLISIYLKLNLCVECDFNIKLVKFTARDRLCERYPSAVFL